MGRANVHKDGTGREGTYRHQPRPHSSAQGPPAVGLDIIARNRPSRASHTADRVSSLEHHPNNARSACSHEGSEKSKCVAEVPSLPRHHGFFHVGVQDAWLQPLRRQVLALLRLAHCRRIRRQLRHRGKWPPVLPGLGAPRHPGADEVRMAPQSIGRLPPDRWLIPADAASTPMTPNTTSPGPRSTRTSCWQRAAMAPSNSTTRTYRSSPS